MARAAVPKYVTDANGFADCAPGHRFNLYFEIWQDDWKLDKNHKPDALRKSLSCQPAVGLLDAIRKRQQTLAAALLEDCRHIIEARSTAPFATGLGLEHPIENGFAFLSPYGLPYLAGSGVKGVLRRAAEELREDGDTDLSQALIDALFGREDDDDARHGALTCWDVFPKPDKDSLMVEIMTPHFTHYYQPEKGKEHLATPHDAGKPNPIPFLAVPAGSEFRFVVTFEPALLHVDIGDWKAVIDKVIQRAFDWLGFGAKTAVGYGAMRRLSAEEIATARAESVQAALRCEWVDQKIRELAEKNRAIESDTLRGKGLAEAWAALTDESLKARALADIRARWELQGWPHPAAEPRR
jgi:CRISPR-associated protein Cmr6